MLRIRLKSYDSWVRAFAERYFLEPCGNVTAPLQAIDASVLLKKRCTEKMHGMHFQCISISFVLENDES